jgi:hypothetical protein
LRRIAAPQQLESRRRQQFSFSCRGARLCRPDQPQQLRARRGVLLGPALRLVLGTQPLGTAEPSRRVRDVLEVNGVGEGEARRIGHGVPEPDDSLDKMTGSLSASVVAVLEQSDNKQGDRFVVFFWDEGRIAYLTEVGEVRARVLDFNHPERVALRKLLVEIGRYPKVGALALLRENDD